MLEHINSSEKHAKVLRFTTTLVLLICLVTPLKGLLTELGNLSVAGDTVGATQPEGGDYAQVEAYVAGRLEEAIAKDLKEKLGVECRKVQVSFTKEGKDLFLLTGIKVKIVDSAVANPKDVCRYLEKNYQCTAEVSQE